MAHDKDKMLELVVINVPDFPRDLLPLVPTFPKVDPEDEKPTEPPPQGDEDTVPTELVPPPLGSVQETIPTEVPPVSVPATSQTRRMDGEDADDDETEQGKQGSGNL